VNEMRTIFANFMRELCKQPAETRVFNGFGDRMVPSAEVPITTQAIDFVNKSKIVCKQVIPLNTHEYSRICKPNGRRPIC